MRVESTVGLCFAGFGNVGQGLARILVRKERELAEMLKGLARPPSLVVTDRQAFLKVAADPPPAVPMTSFSVLFARFKGDFLPLVRGAFKLASLKPGSRVLIAEACTHHQVPDDIGTVQIPRWLRQYAGGDIEFDYVSGGDFPPDLDKYDLIVHCGACIAT